MESIFSDNKILFTLISTDLSVLAAGLKTSTKASDIFVIEDLAKLLV